jgi:hypothetical protein
LIKELPKYGCKENTILLVGIRTAPGEFKERLWVRENWGKVKSFDTPVIFLIANSKQKR